MKDNNYKNKASFNHPPFISKTSFPNEIFDFDDFEEVDVQEESINEKKSNTIKSFNSYFNDDNKKYYIRSSSFSSDEIRACKFNIK